jgi:hypothetical protein
MKLSRKLIVTAALAALPFTALAQSTGNVVDRPFEQQRSIEQTSPSGNSTAQDGSRIDHRNSPISRTDTGNTNSLPSSNLPSNGQRNFNQQERVGQTPHSTQPNNGEGGRNDYRQSWANRTDGHTGADGRFSENGQRHMQGPENRQGRQAYGERRNDQYGRGEDYREANRGRGDYRQAERGRGNEQYRHGGENHAASGYRHDGGFRNGPQPRSFQQHSFQQHSYAQAGGGRRSR